MLPISDVAVKLACLLPGKLVDILAGLSSFSQNGSHSRTCAMQKSSPRACRTNVRAGGADDAGHRSH